ncbi:MAG: HAD hydrolase-like protein [Candidatus Nanohaloarchaea archaeon]
MKKVIAYDIDNTLLELGFIEDVTLEKLKENKEKGNIVGVVSDRPQELIIQGIEYMDIQVDFYCSSFNFEGKEECLNRVENNFSADKYIYVGNKELDRKSAKKAGWKYIDEETDIL